MPMHWTRELIVDQEVQCTLCYSIARATGWNGKRVLCEEGVRLYGGLFALCGVCVYG
jgi:hypothetical protein